jgi:predicted DNA-binding transcriptional regulator YafY
MHNVVERILNLLAFLLTAGRPVTADEIRMTVSGYDQTSDAAWRRMFERDKDLLRQLGIPLELHPTDAWEVEHGYMVPSDAYALPDPGLTDEERAALWLAAKVVHIGGQASGPEALFKLGGSALTVAGEPLAANLGQERDELAHAFTAVVERFLVQFTYRGRARRVAPYGIVHRRGHWYLVGAEDEDERIKVYRMDRADGLEMVGAGNAFDRPEGFRASDAIPSAPWEAGGSDMTARVAFSPEIAWWARRQLTPNTVIVEAADGGFEAELRVANPEAFIGWIISFEDGAKVVDPPELRDRLVARVRGVA